MKIFKMAAVMIVACGFVFSAHQSAFAMEREVSFHIPTLSS